MSYVLLVTNIPTPYRLPLFDAIAKGLEPKGYRLFVLFGSQRPIGRLWEVDLSGRAFEFAFAGGPVLKLPGGEDPTFLYPGLIGLVRQLAPALVITNGFGPSTLKLWLASFLLPRRFAIWSGATSDGTAPLRLVRRWQRRLMLGRAVGSIAYGSAARSYLVQRGQRSETIHVALNTVDTKFFDGDRKSRENGLFTFVCVGDLKAGKRIDLVLSAAAELKRRTDNFRLEIVGDGPLRVALGEQANALGLAEHVSFRGFLQQGDAREALAQADCLVCASEFDVWGLVLNEAMAMGLPVIASRKAGATQDLVLDGSTGFVADFECTAAVAAHMQWLVAHPDEARAMGTRGRAHVLTIASLGATANAWVKAIGALAAPEALSAPLDARSK